MPKFSPILAGIAAIVFASLACNLPFLKPAQQDPGAIMTAAALTVQAQLPASSPSASAPTATSTSVPLPTATMPPPTLPPPPSSTPICDGAQFIADVTYPDNAPVTAGAAFTKTWRLKNIGNCSWTTSYALVFMSGDSMNGPAAQALIGNVNPGQTADISVNLTAPVANGSYTGSWGLRNAAGVIFKSFWVKVNVATVASPTQTPFVFAVTSVNVSPSGACGAFTITASITANGAGTATYHWIRSDGAIDTLAHAPVVFSSAGTQTVSTTWSVSAAGNFWMDIYIDSPNHQQFGRANLHCP